MPLFADTPPAVPAPAPATLLVRVRRGHQAILRSSPGGRIVLRARAQTEFGTPTVMWVQRQRDGWGAVRHVRAGNRKLLWLRLDSEAVTQQRTRWWVRIDRSSRRLEVFHGDRVRRTAIIGVGSSTSPTPVGDHHITDKLDGGGFGSYYGCCVLALSAVQNRTPKGWLGGNRVAIHGTSAPGTIGRAASAGCVRATGADLRAIWRMVPLGAPVRIVA